MSRLALCAHIIIEPDSGYVGAPGWWIWEVSTPVEGQPLGRGIIAEGSVPWRWLAILRATWIVLRHRNGRLAWVKDGADA